MEAEEEVPPVYVTAYLVAVGLGAIKPPENKEDKMTGDAFLSTFGAGGSIRGGVPGG